MNTQFIIYNVLFFSESNEISKKYKLINKKWYDIITSKNFWKLKFYSEGYDDEIFNKSYYVPYFCEYDKRKIL